ncbi:MAG: abortive infection system antitoxin AbiGi family protein [Fodinibius sp.]|nr:abortive infection system antitoxin AbiGi family protein [Fodinibius sp.]
MKTEMDIDASFLLGENQTNSPSDTNIGLSGDTNKLAFQMVCFNDIPLNQAKDHREGCYGDYALVFDKEWVIKEA